MACDTTVFPSYTGLNRVYHGLLFGQSGEKSRIKCLFEETGGYLHDVLLRKSVSGKELMQAGGLRSWNHSRFHYAVIGPRVESG